MRILQIHQELLAAMQNVDGSRYSDLRLLIEYTLSFGDDDSDKAETSFVISDSEPDIGGVFGNN